MPPASILCSKTFLKVSCDKLCVAHWVCELAFTKNGRLETPTPSPALEPAPTGGSQPSTAAWEPARRAMSSRTGASTKHLSRVIDSHRSQIAASPNTNWEVAVHRQPGTSAEGVVSLPAAAAWAGRELPHKGGRPNETHLQCHQQHRNIGRAEAVLHGKSWFPGTPPQCLFPRCPPQSVRVFGCNLCGIAPR